MKYILTDDVELKTEILEGLKKNKEQYGERYCPCVNPSEYNEDYICPCKDFRENVKGGEHCHCGLYIKEKTEEEKTHMNLGSVYDYNKSVYDNFQPLDRIMLNLGQNLVSHFIEDTKNKYYMLLNKENADYTIFTVDYIKPAKRKSAAKILIDECIHNRGQAIDINLTEDKAAIEIWLRNEENENLCYYFFPYDAAIIEV